MEDWKTFLIKHKWIPSPILREKFHIKNYDINNFTRKPKINDLLKPWRIGGNQSADRISEIFKQAWRYYLEEIADLDISTDRREWIPKLIALGNISTKKHFSFLTNSKYLEIACPKALTNYRAHGFTNLALGLFQFYPGEEFLFKNGVLPFMFYQTHSKVIKRISVDDMVEHVYINFLSEYGPDDITFAKEVFYARHDENGFVTSRELSKYGVPPNFYRNEGGLSSVLKRIAENFGSELGLIVSNDPLWSPSEFRKRYPDKKLNQCTYCGLFPVQLHHLLPRSKYGKLTYHSENVVPLCLQIHDLITHNRLNDEQSRGYEVGIERWKSAKDGTRAVTFEKVMFELHEFVYGRIQKI